MRKEMKWFHIMTVALLVLSMNMSHAAPAAGVHEFLGQPDGSMVEAVQKGDEWLNWIETTDGYAIDKSADNYWYYVTGFIGKKAVLSDVPAHKPPPADLRRGVRPCMKRSNCK